MPSTNPSSQTGSISLRNGENYKVAQALYGLVTGKTEKLVKAFKSNYLIELNDLKQLHFKLEQMLTQWAKLGVGHNVTVYHSDDQKEVFSSFDRFQLYDVSHTSPIESLVYEFHFMLAIPEVEKPQPYKVTARIASPVAFIQKVRSGTTPEDFFRFLSASMIIDIEYVDFIVARNILSCVESWVKGLTEVPGGKLLEIVQSCSHFIPLFCPPLIVILTGISAFLIVDTVITPAATMAIQTKFLMFVMVLVFLTSTIAKIFSKLVESLIDSLTIVGGILINVGDRRVHAKQRAKNTRNIFVICIGVFGLLLEGVSVNLVTEQISKILNPPAAKDPVLKKDGGI